MTNSSGPGSASFYGAPRLPAKLLSRQRLIHPLEAAGALTIIRGPAGSGKTVLLADWVRIRASATPGVWVAVDSAASSRGGFWRAVLQAVIDAEIVRDDIRFTDAISALQSPHQLRRELLRAFTGLGQELTLVLDSFEFVTDRLVAEDLSWILRNCGQLQVVVATRTLGPLEESIDSVHLDPAVVTPEQLLLTADETAEILQLAGIEPYTDLAATVRGATGGNALATRAALIAVRNDPSGSSPLLVHRQLKDTLAPFLRRAMFESDWAPHLYEFAVGTAVAEILTVELAQKLSGFDDAESLLNAMEANGLGMWSTGAHGRSFSYTPVVRGALVAEVQDRFPGEKGRLWRTAAQWSAQNGRWMTAIALAAEINDFGLASLFVHQPWFELNHADNARIISLIGPIPRRKLRRHPLLLMLLALAYNAHGAHRLRSLETFGLAVAAMRVSTPTDPAEKVLLMLAETVALRVSGHIERAVPVADKVVSLLEQLGAEGRDQLRINLGTVLNHVGLTFFYSGESEKAMRAFASAYSQAGDRQDRARYHSLALLCGAYAVSGDMVNARRFLDEAATLHWPEAWRDGYVGSMRHLAEAFLALEEFDFESAQAHVTVMRPHLDTLEHWPLFAHVQAMIELGQGHAVAGETALAAEMARSGRPSITAFTRVRLNATRALLLFAAGQGARAEKLLSGNSRGAHTAAVMRARRELLTDNPERAIQILNEVSTSQGASIRLQAEELLITAAAALRLGHRAVAMSSLDQVAAIMKDRGVRFQLMLVPHSDLEALRAESAKRGGALATEFLADLSAVPTVMPETLLKVQLSERERVVLKHLVHNANIAEIAAELFVSANTVKTQVRSVYRKLDVNSREEALLIASDHGLLTDL